MDRKKIFKEIENGNFYLQDADEKLKADKEVVLAAVKHSGSALYDANKKTIESLDYRERAPIKAKEDMFLDENGNVIKDLSTSSFLASGIPGTVDGMFKIHEKYGSLPISKLISPAIDLAEKGFMLSNFQADYFNRNRDKFSKNSETKKIFVNFESKLPDDFKKMLDFLDNFAN